jgi:hypothetical protein
LTEQPVENNNPSNIAVPTSKEITPAVIDMTTVESTKGPEQVLYRLEGGGYQLPQGKTGNATYVGSVGALNIMTPHGDNAEGEDTIKNLINAIRGPEEQKAVRDKAKSEAEELQRLKPMIEQNRKAAVEKLAASRKRAVLELKHISM